MNLTVNSHHNKFLSVCSGRVCNICELKTNCNDGKKPIKKLYRLVSNGIKLVNILHYEYLVVLIREKLLEPDTFEVLNLHNKEVVYSKQYPSAILDCKSTSRILAVYLEKSVYIYDLSQRKKRNNTALVKAMLRNYIYNIIVNTQSSPSVFALGNIYFAIAKSSEPGVIKIYRISENICISSIKADEKPLSVIAFDSSEKYIATVSERGIDILVYSCPTIDGQPSVLYKFYRGGNTANISCLSFSEKSEYLACSSDRKTIHIFKLSEQVRQGRENPLIGERAYYTAQLQKSNLKRSLIVTSSDTTVYLQVITNDGWVQLYRFSKSSAKRGVTVKPFEKELDLLELEDADGFTIVHY